MPFTALQHAPTIWPMRLWVALQDQSCRLRHCNFLAIQEPLSFRGVTGPVMPFTALQQLFLRGLAESAELGYRTSHAVYGIATMHYLLCSFHVFWLQDQSCRLRHCNIRKILDCISSQFRLQDQSCRLRHCNINGFLHFQTTLCRLQDQSCRLRHCNSQPFKTLASAVLCYRTSHAVYGIATSIRTHSSR